MARKMMGWKTKGMNRDMSVSVFSADFAFENRNLRLSTNENNTLMSWVNEKGTSEITTSINNAPWEVPGVSAECPIEGVPIGTAVINNQLVVFTTCLHTETVGEEEPLEEIHYNIDRIYVFKFNNNKTVLNGELLYKGNLNFSVKHPIETLVSYEAEHVQKVYWTDGKNQPRLINIADRDHLIRWNHVSNGTAYPSTTTIDTFFDFIPAIETLSNFEFSVSKDNYANGIFAAGVIQYCFTYVNRYGQQSNIIETSRIYYLALDGRGASPEEKVSAGFNLKVENPDRNFDYVRFYSIQRTSINLEPHVKFLRDVRIPAIGDVELFDNGTIGSTMDPTELLYIGGKEISVITMTDKDLTLFLGNITQKNSSMEVVQEYYKDANNSINIEFSYKDPLILESKVPNIYSYTNQLKSNNQEDITTFKGGEWYRFGFQLQKCTGEWMEPIYLNDERNSYYPSVSVNYDGVNSVELVKATASITLGNVPNFDFSEFKRIRPVIVFPNVGERSVICQGVLNPTVFNIVDRPDNSPYAQSSWFFRPYIVDSSRQEAPVTPPDISQIVTVTKVNDQSITTSNYYTLASTGFETKYMYILIADLYDDASTGILAAETILKNGYLRVWEEGDSSRGGRYGGYNSYFFSGVVKMGVPDTGKTRYIFFKTTPWLVEGFNENENRTVIYQNGVVCIGAESQPFNLYSGLLKNSENMLYYDKIGGPTSYVFAFYITDINSSLDGVYTITFTNNNIDSEEEEEDPEEQGEEESTEENNRGGSYLTFEHYSSIVCQNGRTEYDSSSESLKQIEIQGSQGFYKNPFEEYSTNDLNLGGGSRTNPGELHRKSGTDSNTQFFIDQSILTLHSPDIEFDTEIQNYPKDNLNLRIVGVVPITANVSSHSIDISSEMLETNHNEGNPGQTTPVGRGTFGGSGLMDWIFGGGELDYNVVHANLSYAAGKRLVSEFLWNDVFIKRSTDEKDEDKIKTNDGLYNYLVFPWQRASSLNNDWRPISEASSVLKNKKMANLLFSYWTDYFSYSNSEYAPNHSIFSSVGVDMPLTENAEVMNYRLPRQNSISPEINYYANVDKPLYNNAGYLTIRESASISSGASENTEVIKNVIPMRYLSTSHAVVSLNNTADIDTQSGETGWIPIMPYAKIGNNKFGEYENPQEDEKTYWGKKLRFYQEGIDISDLPSHSYSFLWLAELYKTPNQESLFGGTTLEAIRSNIWLVGGEAQTISNINSPITLEWTVGDTYYQRYDCLKTYAFTNDDVNQLIEILSFMCETHVNIDGRYDRNRGQTNNTNIRPNIFNLINPVYSQQDNFFNYQRLGIDKRDMITYPNQIAYSKTKISGADVDLWTNVTLASVLELDGDKGSLNKLTRFNDQILAFQDTGISQILYNENAAISTQQGVPIELGNSGKVQGKRYFTDTIGCSNKWSLVNTPSGIYFMDSVGKNIFLFNGQLANLSGTLGFNTWCKNNIKASTEKWNPTFESGYQNFVAYYDKKNQEVLFVDDDSCLAYSEKLGAFTSFYDYSKAPYFSNLDDTGIWIEKSRAISDGDNYKLWKHQGGNYCQFFKANYPYSMTLIANADPQIDKIFSNLDFRACIDEDNTETVEGTTTFKSFKTPFDTLETWNEYQHGIANLSIKNGHDAMVHHTPNNEGSIKRKFRMWRCDVPRDNAALNIDNELPTLVSRFKRHPLNRMRNPWIYMKLQKNPVTGGLPRAEIHDILMSYYL